LKKRTDSLIFSLRNYHLVRIQEANKRRIGAVHVIWIRSNGNLTSLWCIVDNRSSITIFRNNFACILLYVKKVKNFFLKAGLFGCPILPLPVVFDRAKNRRFSRPSRSCLCTLKSRYSNWLVSLLSTQKNRTNLSHIQLIL
jgi:hypothetical protein